MLTTQLKVGEPRKFRVKKKRKKELYSRVGRKTRPRGRSGRCHARPSRGKKMVHGYRIFIFKGEVVFFHQGAAGRSATTAAAAACTCHAGWLGRPWWRGYLCLLLWRSVRCRALPARRKNWVQNGRLVDVRKLNCRDIRKLKCRIPPRRTGVKVCRCRGR